MTSYCVRMTYADFRYNMVETDESGPWGDNHFYQTFDKYVDEDGLIEIEYKYGPCVNWKTEIRWKIPETEKAYKLRYGHSSPFAMWWCGLTDEIEEEEKEEDNHSICPRCETKKIAVEFKTDLGDGDVMVCEDCYNEIEGEEESESK